MAAVEQTRPGTAQTALRETRQVPTLALTHTKRITVRVQCMNNRSYLQSSAQRGSNYFRPDRLFPCQ